MQDSGLEGGFFFLGDVSFLIFEGLLFSFSLPVTIYFYLCIDCLPGKENEGYLGGHNASTLRDAFCTLSDLICGTQRTF